MARTTVPRRPAPQRYYYDRDTNGKWIKVPITENTVGRAASSDIHTATATDNNGAVAATGNIVIKNGPTTVTVSAVTGNIVEIRNHETGRVFLQTAHTKKALKKSKTAETDEPVLRLADSDLDLGSAPFGLWLFWKHFGSGHIGCALRPNEIVLDASEPYKCKKMANGNSVVHYWRIAELNGIYWRYLNNLFVPGRAPTGKNKYYFETEYNGQYFQADLSGVIPASIKSDKAFLEVSTTMTIRDDGEVHFTDYSVAKIDGSVLPEPFVIYAFEYPVLRGICQPHTDGNANYLAWPRQDGVVLRNPHLWIHRTYFSDDYQDVKYWPEQSIDTLTNSFYKHHLSWEYPDGYSATMQFMSLYSNDARSGIYLATHDETTKQKTFVLQAKHENDAKMDFRIVNWSDDLCAGFAINSFPAHPIPYDEYVPKWRDYEQKDYPLVWAELKPKDDLTRLSWHDAADKYKNWARNLTSVERSAPWARRPLINRDNFGFYRYTGFGVYLLGSQYRLADVFNDGSERGNFLQAYHDLLKQPGDVREEQRARVLFLMGWDWHFPIWGQLFYANQYQRGNNKNYWKANFGPTEVEKRLNRDQIIDVQKDFLLPYYFGCWMSYSPLEGTRQWWLGWETEDEEDPGSPWERSALLPNPEGVAKEGQLHGMCPATSAFRKLFSDRNSFIRTDPFGDGTNAAISGNYHDIGFSFYPQRCLCCQPNADRPDNYHDHFTNRADNGFQVGTGGFLHQAMRRLLLESMYGRDAIHGSKRRQIFGTEQMTEVLIDGADFYHTSEGLGPIKLYSVSSTLEPYDDPKHMEGYFLGVAKWIDEGHCREVPMFQYVYHPVMPVRTERVNLSGQRGNVQVSKHNIGNLFYWSVAKRYLAGALVELGYAECLMDVPSNTFTKLSQNIPSYMLGWSREHTRYPEQVPNPAVNPTTGEPVPGKHDDLNDAHRIYGDPNKERFLRMMAYMRSFIVPDFLVYGEMLRPGTIFHYSSRYSKDLEEGSPREKFDYEYFWERKRPNHNLLVYNPGSGRHSLKPGDAYGCQSNHSSKTHVWYQTWDKNGKMVHLRRESMPFTADCLLASAWRRFSSTGMVLPTEAVHMVANVGSENRIFVLQVDLSGSFAKHTAYLRTMTLDPRNESTWGDWSATVQELPYHPKSFHWHQIELSLDPHQVVILRFSPSATEKEKGA